MLGVSYYHILLTSSSWLAVLVDEFCTSSSYSFPFPLCIYLQKEEEKPKEKERGKSRNIDRVMEELKHEQEMRERRNQDREHSREGRHSEISFVSVFVILLLV